MTEIKICGITSLEDALTAADCGADALGFIFHRPSPRFVTPERVRKIVNHLPPHIATVGVFVNKPAIEVREIVSRCGLHLIQLHGDESPAYCSQFPASTLIRALSTHSREDRESPECYVVRAFLLDAREGDRYGGTGKTADWDLAARISRRYPLILAGGLQAGNIVRAIHCVRPAAVDLNSGVESQPGKKDRRKIEETVGIIRKIDGAKANHSCKIFRPEKAQ
ncbi:MAG: phosphoribosylanthranilate isomerase [Deltaproteobacteria bacterium]|nr:phosphoribosylanthranilate isomerase [Deltaproteobacteria bacterium]